MSNRLEALWAAWNPTERPQHVRLLHVEVTRRDQTEEPGEPEDASVPGVYVVEVDAELDDALAAAAALDGVHSQIPIALLEDFELTVHDGVRVLHEPDEHMDYSARAYGAVWKEGPEPPRRRPKQGPTTEP